MDLTIFGENEDYVDGVDAMVFSGDMLMANETRKTFRKMMVRWENECKHWDDVASEIEKEEKILEETNEFIGMNW